MAGANGMSASCSWNDVFVPGVPTGLEPASPHSSIRRSACRGSASYSMWSPCHVMTLLRTRISFASSLPGPIQGCILTSYSADMAASYKSNESFGPVAVRSSPCTDKDILRSLCSNTLALPLPCAKPRRTKHLPHSSCQPSAGAIHMA